MKCFGCDNEMYESGKDSTKRMWCIHCINQWGHSPIYDRRKLEEMRSQIDAYLNEVHPLTTPENI